MTPAEPPIGQRPVWPDVVIGLGFAVLVAIGVAAIFGSSIRAWLAGEDVDTVVPVSAPPVGDTL